MNTRFDASFFIEGLMIAAPEALLALFVLPTILVFHVILVRRPAVRFSAFVDLRHAGSGVRSYFRWIPATLFVLAFVLLTFAAARPQIGRGEVRSTREGVAMMLVCDRSDSMRNTMNVSGQFERRIDVVKRVVNDFVLGNEETGLEGRPNDLIGGVAFAGYAHTIAPLSRTHEPLVGQVQNLQLETNRQAAGTAIGDALALALARLDEAEKRLAESSGSEEFTIASKVIVLITDGEENAGQFRATNAAKLCADEGVRVYTIGIVGGRSGAADERLLRHIANQTDGRYWRATNEQSLKEAYQAIDELERTAVEEITHMIYEEAFMDLGRWGLYSALLGVLLSATVLRRLP
ncbi:MAG: VWA domain-containing protein [Planctomycetota bacterium]